MALTPFGERHPEVFADRQRRGRGSLKALERGLVNDFVAGDSYTVADIALYAYVHCGGGCRGRSAGVPGGVRLAGSGRGDAGLPERSRANPRFGIGDSWRGGCRVAPPMRRVRPRRGGRRRFHALWAALAVLLWCSPALAAQRVVDIDPATGTPRMLARLDGTLTGPSSDSPVAIASSFVASHSAELGVSASDFPEDPSTQAAAGWRDGGRLAPGRGRRAGGRSLAAGERGCRRAGAERDGLAGARSGGFGRRRR